MNINDLVPIAVIFVVAFFALSIGSIMVEDLSENACDYTWVDTGTPYTNSSAANPTTGGYWGCCQTAGSTSRNCTAWSTSYSMNASNSGAEAVYEMADWGPTLALVIIAAIIIGVLVTYLGKGKD